ncbi:MAG TPA: helix-hairpin-helix domain-containing protein, partial [Leptospiraceae bacterium]|nr:helix-hairpin-helix domain-containing protein [Leptospiraceae bacterium]
YNLYKRQEELTQIDGFGKKSVDIILKGIEASKQKDFKVLLPSLGFSEVGHKVTELLIESGYDDVDKIISLVKSKTAEQDLMEIHGLGPRTVESLLQVFREKETLALIETLKKLGLNFKSKTVAKSDNQPFLNQSWCVTGSFQNFQPRDKAMDLIVHHGGRKVTSVSSKTTHLLAGEGAGSKMEKALELGVKVVSEEEFMKLLKKEGISV